MYSPVIKISSHILVIGLSLADSVSVELRNHCAQTALQVCDAHRLLYIDGWRFLTRLVRRITNGLVWGWTRGTRCGRWWSTRWTRSTRLGVVGVVRVCGMCSDVMVVVVGFDVLTRVFAEDGLLTRIVVGQVVWGATVIRVWTMFRHGALWRVWWVGVFFIVCG